MKLVEINSVLKKAKYVELRICDKISIFMKENFITDLKYFENKNKIKIDIVSDNSLIIPEYIINLQNKSKKIIEKIEYLTKLKKLNILKNDKEEISKANKPKNIYKKKKFYKKKFYKKKIK